MTDSAFNIHATAIVIGSTGLLFVGPSGWGKSMLAFACISEAKRIGIPATLVADDRVLVSRHGESIIAECPETIAGLIELRGTGIVRMPYVAKASMHYAIIPGDISGQDRIPPDAERAAIGGSLELPAIRLLATAPTPLAILMAKAPEIGR